MQYGYRFAGQFFVLDFIEKSATSISQQKLGTTQRVAIEPCFRSNQPSRFRAEIFLASSGPGEDSATAVRAIDRSMSDIDVARNIANNPIGSMYAIYGNIYHILPSIYPKC